MRGSPISAIRELWQGSPRGTALVEFGLGAPILVLLVIGLVDLGTGFYEALQVQGAASAGAQYASIHGFSQTGIQSAVTGASSISGITATPAPTQVCGCTNSGRFVYEGDLPATGSCSDLGATSCANGGGVYAKVNAQLDYTPILAYPWSSASITLTGHAYRRLQ